MKRTVQVMTNGADIRTDVLVIGGGLAGIMTALSAGRFVKRVAIVGKAPVGKSGNTLVSGAGIAAATQDEGNGAEQFLADLNASAKGLNDLRLSAKLAQDSPRILGILENYGVRLIRQDGAYKRRRPPGHSVPRNIPTDWTGLSYLNRGLSFTLPLLARLHDQNVRLYERIQIVGLLKHQDRVVGAVGRDRAGNWCRFHAGSVILATGGAGYLYGRTNNTRDITGEGLGLALEAGCELQDMEQVQFYPTMMFQPLKVPISNPLFGAGAILRNSSGEEFMSRYDPAGNMATRDSMARAIYSEIQAGRGVNGSVLFDCTRIPAGRLKELFTDLYQFLLKLGLDPSRDYLPVSPCVHYFLGGIRIDPYSRTGVPGLYAAGEICGGIHGANRLSGAALMEACVFGWQAGETAAGEIKDVRPEDAGWTNGYGGAEWDPAEELARLRAVMWDNVSLIRSETGLTRALAYIRAARMRAEHASPAGPLRLMLKVAAAVVQSALYRQESRGAHYRSDFPATGNEFDGNIICRQEGTELKIRFEAVRQ